MNRQGFLSEKVGGGASTHCDGMAIGWWECRAATTPPAQSGRPKSPRRSARRDGSQREPFHHFIAVFGSARLVGSKAHPVSQWILDLFPAGSGDFIHGVSFTG